MTFAVRLVALLALSTFIFASDAHADAMKLDEVTLSNGMRVVIDRSGRVPLASIVLVYRVGTADDPPTRTGLTELTMRLMANRTLHAGEGRFSAELDTLATTWRYQVATHMTTFAATVPTNAIERIFWLFSDGMGFFRPALDQAAIDGRLKDLSTERVSHDDANNGVAYELTSKEIYPSGHPYNHLAGTQSERLTGITVSEVSAHHARWFVPKNAVLIVSGDVTRQSIIGLATKYFQSIDGPVAPARTEWPEPQLSGQTRFDIAASGQSTIVTLTWPTPKHLADGDADLDGVAGILSGERIARLRWALDSDKHLVSSISARQASAPFGSWFVISAVVRAGHTADEVVDAIDTVVEDLKTNAISSDDLGAAVVPLLTRRVYAFERSLGRAQMIAGWEAEAGVADFVDGDLERYQKVTAATFRDAVARYLPRARRVITVVEPDATAPPRGIMRKRTFSAAP